MGILLGQPLLKHYIKKCPVCKREYPYEELYALVPPHGNYCYDIIIEVGMARFRNHCQNKEIQKDIQNRYHLFLAETTINVLANSFLDYFAAVHYAKVNAINRILKASGGYVAHFDGTCEAGTDILFTAIDQLSGIVLLTSRMPSENVKDIKQFFEKCRELYGVPLATMHDLSTHISSARDEVFNKVPGLICQYHFLENVGNALFKKTYQELTTQLRKLKIKPALKSLRNGLMARIKKEFSQPLPEKEFKKFLKILNTPKLPISNLDDTDKLDKKLRQPWEPHLDSAMLTMLRKNFTYFIFRWIDDYCSELKGEYFPFDQPCFVYYQRCVKVYDLVNQLLTNSTWLKAREKQTLVNLVRILETFKKDETLLNIIHRLEKEVNIFKQLRAILRFSRPDSKSILRQRPPISTMKDVSEIDKRLKIFRTQLQKRIADNNSNDPDILRSSKILIDYLDKYYDKLVGHLVTLSGGKKIMLHRTNNISELHFADIKIGWRRKLGTKKLIRQLQAARHEEFLLANLDIQGYIDIVYDGSLDNMPYYFAKYGNKAMEIRKLRSDPEERQTIPISKKLLRKPDMLTGVVQALGGLLSCHT